ATRHIPGSAPIIRSRAEPFGGFSVDALRAGSYGNRRRGAPARIVAGSVFRFAARASGGQRISETSGSRRNADCTDSVAVVTTTRYGYNFATNPIPKKLARGGTQMQDIDQRDRELLGALQGETPLVSTPFAVLGQMIDMSEKEVIKRTERLKREGAIRQLSAQFDPHGLGYRSCLVAAKVDDDHIEQAAV